MPTSGGYGRCAKQLDDSDGDGLGDACDLCPNSNETRIKVSSNYDVERLRGHTVLGDQCDPVPQSISRAIIGKEVFGSGQQIRPLGSTSNYTTF